MADAIILIVKRLGIFMVVAQTLLHFCPNKKYEKYIKMLIGSMSIVILMVPLLGLFQKGAEEEIWSRIEGYGQDMEEMMNKHENGLVYEETNILAETNQEIKSKLNNTANKNGYRIQEVEMVEKGEESLLLISLAKKSSIQIDKIEIERKDAKECNSVESHSDESKMQDLFAQKLGTKENYLEVMISE